jgi:glucarate dehydratase
VRNVDQIAEYDRHVVAETKQAQARIEAEGRAASLAIRDVRVHRVLMPWMGTKRWDGSAEEIHLIEFETDGGLVGIGEDPVADAEALRARMIGGDPFDPALRRHLGLAYWDFVGKVAGKSLSQYLREVFAVDAPEVERIPMAAYTWIRFPDLEGRYQVTYDTYVDHVQGLIDQHGFRVIKISMCDFEPRRYVDLLHRMRAAVGPEIEIRVDPHASWSESMALRFVKAVEGLDLEWIEEPVGGYFESIWRAGERLRSMSTVPISSHSWLPPLDRLPEDPDIAEPEHGRYSDAVLDAPLNRRAIGRYEAADVTAPDAYDGPLALWRYYQTARFMGMDPAMHSGYELGPATAIRLHIAAFAFPYRMRHHIVWGRDPAPFAVHALDAHYNQWEGDVIVGGKMTYEDGFLRVPDGPGLGVELDPERLEHYRYTPEKAERHRRHLQRMCEEHMGSLGWRRDRMGFLE